MRLLVCGGRDYSNSEGLFAALDTFADRRPITEIITGAARGADALAFSWASLRGVPSRGFAAEWRKHGAKAGPLRNQRMIDEGKPDHCIAFPGGRGTADMVARCRRHNIPVTVIED